MQMLSVLTCHCYKLVSFLLGVCACQNAQLLHRVLILPPFQFFISYRSLNCHSLRSFIRQYIKLRGAWGRAREVIEVEVIDAEVIEAVVIEGGSY